MIRLMPDEYAKVTSLVNKVPFNTLFARVVIERMVKGEIFVDDAQSPTVCIVIHKYGMALLCGNHEEDSFNSELARFLREPSSTECPAKWMLTHPHIWEHTLAALFGSQLLQEAELDNSVGIFDSQTYILQTQRVNFAFCPDFRVDRIAHPPGFTVKPIDAELYHKIRGSVVPQFFWNSAEDFLANGIGFALLYDDQIVSSCFASYILDDQLELGVETTEIFRQKGYSVYAAAALVKYSLDHGYEPVWACRRGNLGSYRLAERLGFVPLSYHPYYCMPVR